jgi:glutathione S-transferase
MQRSKGGPAVDYVDKGQGREMPRGPIRLVDPIHAACDGARWHGGVPAIDDGGFVMWETAAINLYLAETYKNALYPSKPQGRGRMLQWTFFATTEVEPPLITLFRNRIFFPPDQRNETLAVQAEETLRAKLAILEDQLVKTQFFGGGTWNMADFMVACVLCVLARLNLDLTSYPRLNAWLAAILNRPAAKAARKLRE